MGNEGVVAVEKRWLYWIASVQRGEPDADRAGTAVGLSQNHGLPLDEFS